MYIYTCIYIYIYIYVCVCVCVYICAYIYLVWRVFAKGPGDRGSILVGVRHKTLKMVYDTSLLKTHQVEQFRTV